MPDQHRAWNTFMREFVVENARVVATLGTDGGALVECLPKLHCAEGRLYTFQLVGNETLNAFEYVFTFHQDDEGDPMASQSVEARIVIEGMHTSGHRLEIRGNGWIGYDNNGKLEGRFDDPPVMLTDEWYDDLEAGGDESESEPFTPVGHFDIPEQFARAMVRFPPVNDD